jgi:16S rRNA processing protein RimM
MAMAKAAAQTRPSNRVLLGEITGVHGIRGEVVIRAYTETPDGISAYGPLETEDGARTLAPEVLRVGPKGVIARLKGIEDRTSAEKLKGTKLYVARERLPKAAENEFYHADLIGLTAVDPSGSALGTIIAVHNFGAGDILEIQLAGKRQTELIAFGAATVPDVDVSAGRVVVVMPSTIEGENPAGRRDEGSE